MWRWQSKAKPRRGFAALPRHGPDNEVQGGFMIPLERANVNEHRGKALRLARGLGQLAFGQRWSDAHMQAVEMLVDSLAGYAAALALAILRERTSDQMPAWREGDRRFEEWRARRRQEGRDGD